LEAGCDLGISYLDLQLLCHSAQRPAISLGKGEFQVKIEDKFIIDFRPLELILDLLRLFKRSA
jgi:hypothetical protein